MIEHPALPAFEIVRAEDASTHLVKRLRAYVSIDPGDADQLDQVAARVVFDLASDNDVVIIFFHFSADIAGKTPAVARAQFVRSGMKQGYVPPPLKSDRRLNRMKTPHGLITVESARMQE
jgi:hypothetical protein